MKPPYQITTEILTLISEIERNLGQFEPMILPKPQPMLRKENKIKTLQGSLAIEGNTLTAEQITAVLDGKRVMAPKNEITEVLNANQVYLQLTSLNPVNETHLLKAHGMMMQGLISDAGQWRSGNVGILKKGKVSHMAPPAERIPHLMSDLLKYLQENDHPLIKGCVFHYEFEFIHPFADGNGRMGRFWHSLLLYDYHPVFEFIPVESLIQQNQERYYEALELCDRAGDSTKFIEFSLRMIATALSEFNTSFRPAPKTPSDRLELTQLHFTDDWFSRKDYLLVNTGISTATASRDLKLGVANQLLEKKGTQATATYRFY